MKDDSHCEMQNNSCPFHSSNSSLFLTLIVNQMLQMAITRLEGVIHHRW